MTRVMRKMSVVVLALLLVFAFSAIMGNNKVSAKGKKVKSVTTKSRNFKKAKAIKRGTTKVINKISWGMIKFKAPKTKTYTFTFYNLNALRKADKRINSVNGSVSFNELRYSKYLSLKTVKTNYGRRPFLQISSKNFYRSFYKFQKKSARRKSTSYLVKRYGKLKLKKGQTVYMRSYFAGVKNSNATYYVKVN